MGQYTARGGIQAPGTAVFGYQRGDDVRASVVEAWGLVVGDHVVEGPLTDDDRPASAPPSEADTRVTWEAWAVANGMSAEDAESASMEDLRAVGAEPADDRPADSAKKSEWVDYAIKRGAEESWARDDSTTKANLQAWTPAPGDTVAVAATEANQG